MDSSPSQGVQVLLGHLRPSVRARVARELVAQGLSVTEVSVPMALRQQATAERSDMVVCPPGWLGEEDRRDLRRQGTYVVELDVETAAPSELLVAVQKGKAVLSEQAAASKTPVVTAPKGTPEGTPKVVSPQAGPASARDRAAEEVKAALSQMKKDARKAAPKHHAAKSKKTAERPGIAKVILMVSLFFVAIALIVFQLRG